MPFTPASSAPERASNTKQTMTIHWMNDCRKTIPLVVRTLVEPLLSWSHGFFPIAGRHYHQSYFSDEKIEVSATHL